jgi:hypothetical protein
VTSQKQQIRLSCYLEIFAQMNTSEFLFYKKFKPVEDWTISSVLAFVSKEGTKEQFEFLQNIYKRKIKAKDDYPLARSIQDFLSKHDKQ